jgi:hypothetical protein
MYIRLGFALALLAIVPACGRVESPQALAGGEQSASEPGSLVKPAFYQTSTAADPGAADAGELLDQGTQSASFSDDRIAQCLASIEQLQSRMDELQNQNRQILAALGIDDQQPAPPPPAGSLADKVLDLQDTVELLAANGEALRRAIEQQTVALKPVVPASADGRLTVENNTDSDRQMWINGTSYWIWAAGKLTVHVPVGEVTTKVPGEAAKTWEITAPNDEVRIEIVRTSQVASSGDP